MDTREDQRLYILMCRCRLTDRKIEQRPHTVDLWSTRVPTPGTADESGVWTRGRRVRITSSSNFNGIRATLSAEADSGQGPHSQGSHGVVWKDNSFCPTTEQARALDWKVAERSRNYQGHRAQDGTGADVASTSWLLGGIFAWYRYVRTQS